jgi:hypothetical protein
LQAWWWLSYNHSCWSLYTWCITNTWSAMRFMTCALCRCNHWDSHCTGCTVAGEAEDITVMYASVTWGDPAKRAWRSPQVLEPPWHCLVFMSLCESDSFSMAFSHFPDEYNLVYSVTSVSLSHVLLPTAHSPQMQLSTPFFTTCDAEYFINLLVFFTSVLYSFYCFFSLFIF